MVFQTLMIKYCGLLSTNRPLQFPVPLFLPIFFSFLFFLSFLYLFLFPSSSKLLIIDVAVVGTRFAGSLVLAVLGDGH